MIQINIIRSRDGTLSAILETTRPRGNYEMPDVDRRTLEFAGNDVRHCFEELAEIVAELLPPMEPLVSVRMSELAKLPPDQHDRMLAALVGATREPAESIADALTSEAEKLGMYECERCNGQPRAKAPCFCVDMGATMACLVHNGCPRHDGCPLCHGTGRRSG